MESWVQRWRPRTNAFCNFSTPPVESTAPATKKRCQVIGSAAPVTQNHLRKSTYLMLQNATPLRKSAPWPPNISDEHVSCTAPARWNASLQILFKCPTPAIVFGNATKPYKTLTFCSLLTRCTIPCACHAKRDLNVQKWSEAGVFCAFWLGNVLRATTARHNGVHFFDISSAKSGPHLVCFAHFDLEMCFAPQRRALFRYLKCQKWSDVEKVHAVVARSTFPSQNVKTPQLRSTLRSCDVEKVHAVVARSTFRSQNVRTC